MDVDLKNYDNRDYSPGGSIIRRILWYLVNATILNSFLFPSISIKPMILRAFGARVGIGVIIKPRVNIKYPWHLTIGDHAWIGEGVWIDNLTTVQIGSNVCISQEAYLLTGNHDYHDPLFGLITAPIYVEDGAWVGARAVVCPGVRIANNSILTVGSILTKDTLQNGIYSGNPAVRVRDRISKIRVS